MAAIMQKNTSETCREWIASILRGDGCGEMPVTEDAVLAAAGDEGVVALLRGALGAGPAASRDDLTALTKRLLAAEREQVAAEILRNAEAQRVSTILLDAGLPFLLLKGAALAYRIYERPHQRPRCDLDLLMPTAAVVESARPLLKSLGYAGSAVGTDTLLSNETEFRRQASGGSVHWIDAHWALTGNALFGTRFGYAELALDSVCIPCFPPAVRGLGDVHALIHACLHRVSNMRSGQEDRLIWLYDVVLLAGRLSPAGWERLVALATDRGVAGPVLGGIEAAKYWLSCSAPESVFESLRCAAANEPFDLRHAKQRGYLEWHSFRALPARLRGRWLWEKLFPSAAYIEEWSGRRGRGVAAAHYARRLLNLTHLFRRQ